jgi:hypothetical protein
MYTIRKIKKNNQTFEILTDEQGTFLCKKGEIKYLINLLQTMYDNFTEEEIIFFSKKNLLETYPNMFPQIYSEDDSMWLEYCSVEIFGVEQRKE